MTYIMCIMKKNDKYYETLCNNHNTVIHNLQQLKKNVQGEATRRLINETLDVVRYCKKQGQRMEDRMKSYMFHITALGFQRVYKTKDKEWKK